MTHETFVLPCHFHKLQTEVTGAWCGGSTGLHLTILVLTIANRSLAQWVSSRKPSAESIKYKLSPETGKRNVVFVQTVQARSV